MVDTPENGETTNSDTENGVANLPLLDENRPVGDNSEAAIIPEKNLIAPYFPSGPQNPISTDTKKISNISITENERENCDVYYYESGSTELKEFNGTIAHTNYDAPYGVVFFVAPRDGYALTKITADTAKAEFYSIANNEEIHQTEFYTKNSNTGNKTPVKKLIAAGFDENNLNALVTQAKEKKCVAAFIFSRSGRDTNNIVVSLGFYAKKLATLEKTVTGVKRNNETIDLETTKVRAGDVIEYSFKVTYDSTDGNLTYKDVTVTDSRLTDPQKMTFTTSETETQKATYTVTEQDIVEAAKNGDKLTNTATLTYTYQAPYNNGEYTVSDTATANVTTVSSVIYQYTGDVPSGVSLPDSVIYEKGDSVSVATAPENVTGYTFSGWSPTDVDVTVNKGKFTMPGHSVTFTGTWTANSNVSYKVHYYKDGTTDKVFDDKVVENQTFNASVMEEAPTVTGYTVVGSGKETMTLNAYGKEITFYYTQNEPITDTVDAKYFILTPSMTAPTDGSSQGVGNYFPNDSDCGGVEGKTTSTGYPGKIKSTLLNKYPKVNTQAGYADTTNGIGADYLVLPGDLGYFSRANYTDGVYTGYNKDSFPDVLKNLVGEGNQFNMNNYQIVWYVAKLENDGYHVDGYLKGVSIQLKYFDNFNGATTEVKSEKLESGDQVTIEGENIIIGAGSRTGWNFEGWTTQANGDGEVYQPGQEKTLITSTSLYAKWTTSYSVVTHFVDDKGNEETKTNSDLRAAHGKLLKELVLPRGQVDTENKYTNYVYDASKTTYVVDSAAPAPVGENKFTSANTVIHQYYYLDNWKDADETTDETDKDAETGGDGIPDCDQVLIKYVSSNSDRGTVSPDMEVLTIRKDNERVEPTANGSTATDKGGRNYFSNWTDKDNTRVSTNATLNNETIQNAIKEFTGGKTYTFTANFGYSSGGGGGGSRPTVTIPDDVPTGLNGTDHYAYIIGYGNNDVRPQNNITRAEVATIFFRLLTDETRTANMTKSNSYTDVKDGDWFCCAVSTLSKMGIIKGYEDGSFKPNDPISRAEFAAIAARFDPDGDKTPATFADVTSHWAKDEISIAANHGWIKGYEDGSFKPDQKITRAETMTLVNRVLNRLPETKDDLHKDMKTWVDNMDETAWYYLDVQEATNSHYFKNKTNTKFEQWTDLRDTRDWSELEK